MRPPAGPRRRRRAVSARASHLRAGSPEHPAIVVRRCWQLRKNVSYDPATGRVGGTTRDRARTRGRCAGCSQRFSETRSALVGRHAAGAIATGSRAGAPASVRPKSPGAPRRGGRTTRACTSTAFRRRPCRAAASCACSRNVNPEGRPRSWRIGGDFDAVARRFAPRLRMPSPGIGARCCALLRVTKSRRVAPTTR